MMTGNIVEVVVLPDARAVAAESARHLLELATAPGGEKFVALSGGTTPRLMYFHLASLGPEKSAPLRSVNYFMGDERAVSNYHEDSNVRLAVEGLMRPLEIPNHRLNAPDGAAGDLPGEARRYTRVIEEILPRNAEGIPIFDLVYLGMGGDGHTASLFPGTAALAPPQAACVANDVPQLSTRRLTFTFPLLNAARHAVISLTGHGKAAVLAEIMADRAGRYPIENISARRVTWILDEEAAGSLTPEQIDLFRRKGH